MKLKTLFIVALASLSLASCSSKRSPLTYFTDIDNGQYQNIPAGEYGVSIRPDDELYIVVTSFNPEATAPYNLPLANPATASDLIHNTTPRQQTYIVDAAGNLNFPMLGTIHAEGLTIEQLQAELTKRIGEDVENPLVRVELVNFRVNVAGEVRSPRAITVTRNRYSILDALTDAGDLTEYGERDNVLLIREENGERKHVRLNLNSSDILTSPYFYLKQNDYIYVEPNQIRQANSKYNQNNAFKLSVTSTIVSAASVIASLVIALTVK